MYCVDLVFNVLFFNTVVTTIRQLLIEPNFEASIMAQEGRTKFESTAKEWTLKYAMKY